MGQKPVWGQAFNFSVAIGSDFTFSMDTRSKAASPVIKKKASPSTLKRNARRREEYLQRKKNPSKVKSTEEVETVSDALSCDQCDYKPASEKGLKQHKRMKDKTPQPKESLRHSGEGSASLSASLTLDTTREEKEFSFSSTPGKEKEVPATSPQPPPSPTRPTVAQMQESLALYRALHSKPVATK